MGANGYLNMLGITRGLSAVRSAPVVRSVMMSQRANLAHRAAKDPLGPAETGSWPTWKTTKRRMHEGCSLACCLSRHFPCFLSLEPTAQLGTINSPTSDVSADQIWILSTSTSTSLLFCHSSLQNSQEKFLHNDLILI